MIKILGRERFLRMAGAIALAGLLSACGHSSRIRVQGYVEGEFVYVSSQLSGPLQNLEVYRGTEVKEGAPLFELDRTLEKAALDQAHAELTFSEKDFQRQEALNLASPGSASIRDFQLSRSTRDQDLQRLAQAQWNFDQKSQGRAASGSCLRHALSPRRMGRGRPPGHPTVAAAKYRGARFRARNGKSAGFTRGTRPRFLWMASPRRLSGSCVSFSRSRNTRRPSSTARKAATSWSS